MDPLKPLLVVAGVLRSDHGVLLTQRHKNSHLGGYWEFPGGKVDPGERPDDALRREWHEELDVRLTRVIPWTFAHHSYPEKTVLILFFRVECDGSPSPQEDQAMRWVDPKDLSSMKLPEADRELVALICAEDPPAIS